MNKKDYLKINLNEYVYVKLNEKGIEKWRSYYDLPWRRNNDIEKMKKIYMNDEGYIKFQLHNFMEIFGDGIHSNYFEDINICFLKEQLKELE